MQKINEDKELEIIRMYLDKIPNNQISQRLGVSLNKIGSTLRSHSIERRSKKDSAQLVSMRHRDVYGEKQDLLRNGKFSVIKMGADSRGLSFEISLEEAWNLYESQNRLCALTGLPIVFKSDFSEDREGTASLDRIDSSKGYELDNLQWVHKHINLMKGNFSQEDFIKMCIDITNFQDSKKDTNNQLPI